MGYYTDFELAWKYELELMPSCEHYAISNFKFCPDCGRKVEMIPRYTDKDITFFMASNPDEFYPLLNEERGKWYDHKISMLAMSKEFPDVLFTLTGEGERNDDMWKEYYKNGRFFLAKAVITYPEFDEAKLV